MLLKILFPVMVFYFTGWYCQLDDPPLLYGSGVDRMARGRCAIPEVSLLSFPKRTPRGYTRFIGLAAKAAR
jgi:hypothetical protein